MRLRVMKPGRGGAAALALVACLAAAGGALGAGDLAPIHTSADSGFQVLRAYKGKLFGGTYGGDESRIYRITRDEFVEEARISAESVSVLALCPGEACLIANLERLDKSPTVFRRDDGAGSWADTGIGNDYPESEKAMGIGGGTAGGKVWAAVLPYIPGRDAVGYVWSSPDGSSWSAGPHFERSIPMAFADFNGKVWTGTIYGGDANGVYWLDGGTWRKVHDLPDTWVSDMAVFAGSLYIATEGGIYRMAPDESIAKITEFGSWMAVGKETDGTDWLYSGKGQGWRCGGGESELWRTANGADWELYQKFPECEFQGVAVIHNPSSDQLFVGTRQEGGHGRIYYKEFVFGAPPEDEAREDPPPEVVEPAEFTESLDSIPDEERLETDTADPLPDPRPDPPDAAVDPPAEDTGASGVSGGCGCAVAW